MALVNTFGSLHWAREGYSSLFIGAAWALGVVCETTFFALVGRWVAGADRAASLLALGGLAATLRWLVMASDPGAVLLALAQAAHGFSFAATHAGSMFLIFELAPHAMRARAQGWLTAAIAGVSALVVTASGPLYAGLWRGRLSRHGGPRGARRRAGDLCRREAAADVSQRRAYREPRASLIQ